MITEILKYLSAVDLTLCVPELGAKWTKLSRNLTLWRNLVFEAPDGMSDSHIMRVIQKAPRLRHFQLNHATDIHAILRCLMKHCDDIRTIRIKWKKGPEWYWIPMLLHTYNNLECLECYVIGKYTTLDYARYLGDLEDRKSIVLNEELDRFRTRHYEEEFYQKTIVPFDDHHADGILRRNRGLRHLSLDGKILPKTVGHLYDYNNLKSLFVHSHGFSRCVFDIAKLSCISTLENFHLHFYCNIFVKFSPEGNVQFPRLVKLEIISIIEPALISGLLSACKKLEFLRFLVNKAEDDDLAGLEECRNLKHLDLSLNNPGFGNDTLSRISRVCHELEFLDLSWSERQIRYNLENLKNCTKLRYLRLNNQIVTDLHLRVVQETFQDLRELNITNCSLVTDYGLSLLKRKMPGLRIIRRERVIETFP